MELCLQATGEQGLTDEEIRSGLLALLSNYPAKKVLILPPDYTRYHSKAGFLTQICYAYYTACGATVDILPTLGTHRAMTREEAADMFGGILHAIFRQFVAPGRDAGDAMPRAALDTLLQRPLLTHRDGVER